MNIVSIIRITTVVGLSAIKLVSTALKVKEAKQKGLINPWSVAINNNSTPYMQGQQPMMNNGFNSNQMVAQQPQQTWSESRRFMNVNPQPQQYYPQPQQQIYPQTNINYDSQSRRYAQPTYNQPTYNPTTYLPSNWQSQQQYPQGYQVGPTVAQYNNNSYYSNSALMTINSTYDTLDGYVPKQQNYYNQPQSSWRYQQPYQSQELKWCDKSYGQMMEEQRRLMQPKAPPKNTYGSPMFNWNSPWLKGDYSRRTQDDSGVVAFFSTNDGTPLFGPSPTASAV